MSRSPTPKKSPTRAQKTVRAHRAAMQRQKAAQPVRHSSLLLYLWMALALPELILHLTTSKNADLLLDSGLLLGPVFAAVPGILVFLLATSLPRREQNYTVAVVYSLLALVLCGSQLIYYRIFGTFYTFYSVMNGAAALQFVTTILTALRENWFPLLLMAGPLLYLLLTLGRPYYFKRRKALGSKLTLLVFATAIQSLAVASLPMLGGTGDTSAYGLYRYSPDMYLSVNRLGLATAFRLDVARALTGDGGGDIILEIPDPVPTETLAPLPTETSPPETIPPETTLPLPAWDTGPNVLPIDFDSLIQAGENRSVHEIHRYFASRQPSHKNKMTGLFEGSNLILITAEAFSHLVLDPVRTPTLYKLATEGIQFSNFYVPDWGVSTTDGEYAHLTGTIPKSGVWSFKKSAENLMPLTMNRQLMALGYSSYAYHGHTYNYYSRDEYLTNLGYQYKGLGAGLDIAATWPESDVEVIDQSTGDYLTGSPFSVYYMTISGHREFTFTGNYIAYKNRDLVQDLPYSSNVRAYLACQLELEHAMTLLLQRLEEAGVLQDTVIVLTADHYPNGLTPEELGELSGKAPETSFELYKNGCFIYKSGMTPVTVDAPASPLDLLPTLSNLFGLEFDSRLYMGRDVFSEAPALVMFRDKSWITDTARYDAASGKVTFFDGADADEDYVQSINTEVSNRFAVSTRILELDYWRILFPGEPVETEPETP